MSFRVFSLDLTKIPKDKIIDGKKGGKYISLVMWDNDEPDDYGNDFSVQYNRTKEEKDAGMKPVYIGNGKIMGTEKKAAVKEDEGLPF